MKPKYVKVPQSNTTPARKLRGGEGPLTMKLTPVPERLKIIKAKNQVMGG